jgi:carbon storage regulator
MLVFSRKEGDEIRIGDDIVIRVLEVTGSTVRVGVDAPRSVPVHRGEIYDIRQENARASSAPADGLPGLNFGS